VSGTDLKYPAQIVTLYFDLLTFVAVRKKRRGMYLRSELISELGSLWAKAGMVNLPRIRPREVPPAYYSIHDCLIILCDAE
jgi:hypothetical protein